MAPEQIAAERINRIYEELDREARQGGYHLNSDPGFVRLLIEGLLTNEDRFGYRSCPCRLASGKREEDLDIICPCDYRDADLEEYGACYCSLYVSRAVADGDEEVGFVPERRPPAESRSDLRPAVPEAASVSNLAFPVWRCRVCGYLCARDEPPGVCPICKATKDRFERFL